ncbi:hypothetical protein MsAg5_00280 [Methanosarcinaceae archaeon Ag5]|uniref:Uncharacterized protein n=1 Tax=Methanolapillus africanus TaxID=3028297 RepID=A0AAE4SCC6_9EURY|nr:hypothetical protein [Methanosarcinaceae archaeon Ag5]
MTDFYYITPDENIQLFSGTLYHGTTKENAANILENNFLPSSNPNLHLGDGVYFYDNETYAIWWVIKKPVCKVPKDRLKKYISEQDLTLCKDVFECFLKNLEIIVVEIENAKHLSLDDSANKRIFENFYQKLKGKNEQNQMLNNRSIYNVFFEWAPFKNEIDMASMTTNYYNFSKNRSPSNPMLPHEAYLYKIYCVKNIDILKKRKRLYMTPENIEYCLEFMIRKEQLFRKNRGD